MLTKFAAALLATSLIAGSAHCRTAVGQYRLCACGPNTGAVRACRDHEQGGQNGEAYGAAPLACAQACRARQESCRASCSACQAGQDASGRRRQEFVTHDPEKRVPVFEKIMRKQKHELPAIQN